MKLLFLGLIIISLLLIKIYYIFRKEGMEGMPSPEVMAQNERDFEKSTEKKISVKIDGKDEENQGVMKLKKFKSGKVSLNIGSSPNSLESTDLEGDIKNCSSLLSCDNLNDGNCGYCSTTKLFSYGDKKGSKSDVCPGNGWTTNKDKCMELRDKEICKNVGSCADLYGEAAKICGFCPTTGKSYPMEKIGKKYFPKYSDDVCPNSSEFGLLPGDKCGAFLKDHPCITPYHESGPHSGKCIEKLWKNSGCTTQGLNKLATNDKLSSDEYTNKLGKMYGADKNNIKSYKWVGGEYNKYNSYTRSNNYDNAKSMSERCFGNSDNINACDSKYNQGGVPTGSCLKEKYLEAGCNIKGTGYKKLSSGLSSVKKHVSNVNKYIPGSESIDYKTGKIVRYQGKNTTNVSEYIKNIINLESLTVNAEDYETRKETSMICFGEEPPAPPEIKGGDSVYMYHRSKRYDGIATGIAMLGGVEKAKVLWTQVSRVDGSGVRKRENFTKRQEIRELGWDGIAPTQNTSLTDNYGWINKRKLKLKKSCQNIPSSCNLSCKDKIREVLLKFPKPLNCQVSSWGKWSNCTKKCGGGTKTRQRRITNQPKFGGRKCPSLKQTWGCNTNPCLNNNFIKQ
jgi:hypothetical protein